MPQTLPRFFQLSPQQVREIAIDADFRREGAHIHFVVDVHDLAEFCFPIDPKGSLTMDLSDIADDQIALREIFLRRKDRPILVREYEDELQRNHRALSHSSAYAREIALEMLSALEDSANVDETKLLPIDILRKAEASFNLILSAAAGGNSLGLVRWEEIQARRLIFEDRMSGLVPELIVTALRNFSPSELSRSIADALIAGIPADIGSRTASASRIRAAQSDALVVEKVIQVNRVLEQAFIRGELAERHLILYLSSARRNRRIFDLKQVRDSLPVVAGKVYSPWRNRTQIFLSMVLRPNGKLDDENSSDDFLEQKDSLNSFAELLESVAGSRPQAQSIEKCSNCVLDGGVGGQSSRGGTCQWKPLCEGVKLTSPRYLAEDVSGIQNIGLMTNLRLYSDLLKKKPATTSGEAVQAFLAYILDHRKVQDLALERMWVLRQTLSYNSEVLQNAAPVVDEQFITSSLQTLPIGIHVEHGIYKTIVAELIAYYQSATNENRHELLANVYTWFSAEDRDIRLFTSEHELVRSLIYLAFEGNDRSGRSLKHAQSARERVANDQAESRWLLEFSYVQVWAERLHGRNHACDVLCKRLISEFPEDPRLHHGRMLNAYEWLEHGSRDYTVQEIVEIGERALALYEEAGSLGGGRFATPNLIDQLIAVTCNDLSFLYCFSDTFEDLLKSRIYLERIGKLIPQTLWYEAHPEFLHTEGMLLYKEARAAGGRERFEKLLEASEKVKAAVRFRSKNSYVNLATDIDALLNACSA